MEQVQQETSKPKKSNRGFASMDKARQREISAKGGRIAHLNGTAHEFSSEEARAAGRKGGEARHANRQRMLLEAEALRRKTDDQANSNVFH